MDSGDMRDSAYARQLQSNPGLAIHVAYDVETNGHNEASLRRTVWLHSTDRRHTGINALCGKLVWEEDAVVWTRASAAETIRYLTTWLAEN